MNILALEPYYGGSHRHFLDGWVDASSHHWSVCTLPARKWKWRMRHGAVSFAREAERRWSAGERWECVFCSSMLNLAEWRGLAPPEIAHLPTVVYFHENQLGYPLHKGEVRDFQYAITHFTTALSADELWFNSKYHQDSFFTEMRVLLKKMPDYNLLKELDSLEEKSRIMHPGIKPSLLQKNEEKDKDTVPVILWAARWEYDKNPVLFFSAVRVLREKGYAFQLSVIGEHFASVPPVFRDAKEEFAAHLLRWGYQESREAYEAALNEATIVVSTADHEFFGISMVEAVAAGAVPVIPRLLAYPEVFENPGGGDAYFYDGSEGDLVRVMESVLVSVEQGTPLKWLDHDSENVAEKYSWAQVSSLMDTRLTQLVE